MDMSGRQLSTLMTNLLSILLNFITLKELVFSLPSTNNYDSPNSARSSIGCAYSQLPDGMRTDELTLKTVNIDDPRLSDVTERQFYVRVPGSVFCVYHKN